MMSRGNISHILVPSLLLFVAACASGSTKVEMPVAQKISFEQIDLVKDTDTVTVPENVTSHFHKRLNDYLFKNDLFASGKGLVIRYRFVQYDEGSRAKRYFIGFGSGKGTMTLDVTFYNQQGEKLADIDVGGELSFGFFGGDIDEAVSKAAKKVADYTITNFK